MIPLLVSVLAGLALVVVGVPVAVVAVATRTRSQFGRRLLLGAGAALLAVLLARVAPPLPAWALVGLVGLIMLAPLPARRGPRLALPAGPGRGRDRRGRVDPGALDGIWARLVQEALDARAQFLAAAKRAPAGAIRERLTELRGEIDHALAQAWQRAQRGWELERSAEHLTPAAGRQRARWGRGWSLGQDDVYDPRVAEATRARDRAAGRLRLAVAEERAQLQVVVARLSEAACSAAELSVVATGVLDTPAEADRTRELVDRLGALRTALTEVANPAI